MKDYTIIRFDNPTNVEFNLSVIDINGKKVMEQTGIKTNEYHLNRGGLDPGVYVVEIKSAEGKNNVVMMVE